MTGTYTCMIMHAHTQYEVHPNDLKNVASFTSGTLAGSPFARAPLAELEGCSHGIPWPGTFGLGPPGHEELTSAAIPPPGNSGTFGPAGTTVEGGQGEAFPRVGGFGVGGLGKLSKGASLLCESWVSSTLGTTSYGMVASRRKAVSGVSGTVWTLSGVLASATNFPSLVAIIGAPQLRLSWYPISKHVTKKQPMRMTHYIMAPSTMEGSRESRLGSVPSRSAVCKMSIFSCCA